VPSLQPTITATLDSTEFRELVEYAAAEIKRIGRDNLPERIAKLFFSLQDGTEYWANIESDTAPGTRELRFRLEPSERFRELVAALRALDG